MFQWSHLASRSIVSHLHLTGVIVLAGFYADVRTCKKELTAPVLKAGTGLELKCQGDERLDLIRVVWIEIDERNDQSTS